MAAIKALILDCGGVICRPARGHWLLATDLEQILGALPAFPPDLVASAHARAMHWLDESRLVTTEKHEYELRLNYSRDMNEYLNAGYTCEQMQAIAKSITWDDKRYEFYADAIPYIRKWAQSYRVGLLSDAMPSLMRVLARAGLSEVCDSIVISCLSGFQKPDARMYAQSIRELEVLPGEALFVDDLEKNLLGASRMGLRAARMTRDVYTCLPAAPFETWTGASVRDFSELDALLAEGAI